MRILLIKSTKSWESESPAFAYCERFGLLLSKQGHRVDYATLPFVSKCETILEQVMGYRLLDITASADRIIVFDSPSCLLKHPNKAIVLTAAFTPLSDLIPDGLSTLKGNSLCRLLRQAQATAFAEAEAVFFEDEVTQRAAEPHWKPSRSAGVCLNSISEESDLANQLAVGSHKPSVTALNARYARRVA